MCHNQRQGTESQERARLCEGLLFSALGVENFAIVISTMVGDERVPSFSEKFMAKAGKDPLVPIGAAATVGFLVSGACCDRYLPLSVLSV